MGSSHVHLAPNIQSSLVGAMSNIYKVKSIYLWEIYIGSGLAKLDWKVVAQYSNLVAQQ